MLAVSVVIMGRVVVASRAPMTAGKVTPLAFALVM
jgi:hypothetical protein